MGVSIDVDRVERAFAEAMRIGAYEEAAKVVFRGAIEPILNILAKLAKTVSDLAKLTEENSRNIDRLTGELRRLRGRERELRVISMLEDWFRRKARDYDAIRWDGSGADLLVEGKGLLASVEIAVRPNSKDLVQLKNGIGTILDRWGRKPDVLILYSTSGELGRGVSRRAGEEGVYLARSPADVKRVLDEVASSRSDGSSQSFT